MTNFEEKMSEVEYLQKLLNSYFLFDFLQKTEEKGAIISGNFYSHKAKKDYEQKNRIKEEFCKKFNFYKINNPQVVKKFIDLNLNVLKKELTSASESLKKTLLENIKIFEELANFPDCQKLFGIKNFPVNFDL